VYACHIPIHAESIIIVSKNIQTTYFVVQIKPSRVQHTTRTNAKLEVLSATRLAVQ
jgi:hypothetical protein